MALHFFYESLGTYAKDKEFWLRMLYLGMKVGDRFAAHAKIYEKGREEKWKWTSTNWFNPSNQSQQTEKNDLMISYIMHINHLKGWLKTKNLKGNQINIYKCDKNL